MFVCQATALDLPTYKFIDRTVDPKILNYAATDNALETQAFYKIDNCHIFSFSVHVYDNIC